MERSHWKAVQNFDISRSDILKKRLLTPGSSAAVVCVPSQSSQQHNASMNAARAAISNSMLVTSVAQSSNSIAVSHNLLTTPMKIQTNSTSYPLQLHLGNNTSLSTVNVPVQIPGSTSNINVPVQISSSTGLPLQLTPTVSLPLQVSATTVPLQLPNNQNIQLATPVQSVPIIQNNGQPSIIHVHMNQPRNSNMDSNSESTTQETVQVKLPNNGSNPVHLQIPSSNSNAIQLLPSSVGNNPVQIRNNARTVPHVVYIQTPTGLKQVTSSDVINTASSSGNPPQIIVRRPVSNTSSIQFVSNLAAKTNLAPKTSIQNKSSILTAGNASQPIVIQKPKGNATVVPVSIATNTSGKQTFAYLSTVKKPTVSKVSDQSILLPNAQQSSNQKLFLTPIPKTINTIQNTKFILPVSLPGTMTSKGPIINLQIANGQLHNDSQGNIKVMRDNPTENTEMPPLQPFGKVINTINGKESSSNSIPHSPKTEKSFALSIPGSRAEPTGEQEYSLSIPETNASMSDELYVSIEDDEGATEKSFTLTIPEKGKSLLNTSERETTTIPAPAILRRSNSEHHDKKSSFNLKRRISLCNENLINKNFKLDPPRSKTPERQQGKENELSVSELNDDHRVPSLFCDEKLDKDLENKNTEADDDRKEARKISSSSDGITKAYRKGDLEALKRPTTCSRVKRESSDSTAEEDPPGLIWSNGMAHLQGSDLQFVNNEFGIIDVIENGDQEDYSLNPILKYHTPLKQRIERGGRERKPASPEDLYCCDGCGCHGMAAEFVTPNFCSLTCQNEVQKAAQKKKDRDTRDLLKKRNKMKRLLLQKHSVLFGSDRQNINYELEQKIMDTAAGLIKTDEPENPKYPWMCGKNGFSWMKYLEVCKAKAAPVKLFKDPFPYNRNGFKVGMKLEAIDPIHASVFCVVSVAEVQGYRMRLHFDEYPDMYDFWVNADCIDLFPPGWCEKNGRSLKPPIGFTHTNFSWALYLKQTKSIGAPRHLFPHLCSTMVKPNGFRIGMKLEAEDKKNNLVCVATVADMLDNRILINFDSWDEMYDYWVDPSSPYIHPVGYAEENGNQLTPPNFYKDPDSFTWDGYLTETNSTPVPPRSFKPRPVHGFKCGMKLEVVDKRVPFLIRVATVTDVKEHQVRISFDGWPDSLSHWFDDDSPDIHPVGWCLKTGHPLEPPLTNEELAIEGGCGVAGCRGLGSLRGGPHKTHSAASMCPYRSGTPTALPDRLAPDSSPMHLLPRPRKGRPPKSISTPTSDVVKGENKPSRGRPRKHKRVEEILKEDLHISDEESIASSAVSKRSRQSTVEATVSAQGFEPRSGERRLGSPRQDIKALVRQLALPSDPLIWSQCEVRDFVKSTIPAEVARRFVEAEVTGPDFIMLSQEEMVDSLGLKLGPAIKLYNAVLQLRNIVIS